MHGLSIYHMVDDVEYKVYIGYRVTFRGYAPMHDDPGAPLEFDAEIEYVTDEDGKNISPSEMSPELKAKFDDFLNSEEVAVAIAENEQ